MLPEISLISTSTGSTKQWLSHRTLLSSDAEATDFVVGVGGITGEHFSLPCEQLLLIGRQRVPFFQVIRPGCQLRVGRDDAKPLLIGKYLLAKGVPAHVELALELVDPFLGRLMRRMGAAGHVIEEERLIRIGGIELSQVGDRVVRHVRGQIVAGVSDPGENLGGVPE